MAETNFDKKIKPIFAYVGSIGAVLAAIAYVIIVVIMVFGVAVSQTPFQTLIFAVINAVIGLIIMQFLKIQGMDLAKRLDQNIPILKEWNLSLAKEKKLHGLKWFWFTTLTKDIIIKCVTLAATTYGIIYIVVAASQDYTLLFLALVNLIMFACFGFLSLVKAYDFFNDEYIPFLKEKINEKKERERIAAEEIITKESEEREKIIEAEIKRRMALAQEQLIHKGYVDNNNNCGNNILESSMDNCANGTNNKSMVLDSNNSNNSVLVCTTDSRNNATTSVDSAIEKNIQKSEE